MAAVTPGRSFPVIVMSSVGHIVHGTGHASRLLAEQAATTRCAGCAFERVQEVAAARWLRGADTLPPSSRVASRTISIARRPEVNARAAVPDGSAIGASQPGRRPQVQHGIRGVGTPRGHVQRDRAAPDASRSADRSSRSAAPTSGRYDGGLARAARQCTAWPTVVGSSPRPAPCSTTAWPASSASRLKSVGPPSPSGSPGRGRHAETCCTPYPAQLTQEQRGGQRTRRRRDHAHLHACTGP